MRIKTTDETMELETRQKNSEIKPPNINKSDWVFRPPHIDDGSDIHQLISSSAPLDENSSYCNFLQAVHFQKSCIIAQSKDQIAGFISAFLKPEARNELFIWQVAVSPQWRGHGLAFDMLKALLQRDNLKNIQAVETTITQKNDASWGLFKKIDAFYGNHGTVGVFLDKDTHFKGQKETEYLYRIPLKSE